MTNYEDIKNMSKYGKMSLADVKSINNIAVVKQDKVTGYDKQRLKDTWNRRARI